MASSDRKPVHRGKGWLSALATGVSAAVVFIMMMITVVDVIGRYVFNAPLFGALELTELLMGLLVYMGLPLATYRREHITISLLTDALPPWLADIQHRLFDVVCGATCGFVAWRMWIYAGRLVRSGEHTQQLQIEVGFVVQAMSVLMWVTAAVFVVNALRRRETSDGSPDLNAL